MGDTEEKILDVVWGGISQGRDVKTVAADLMAYLKGGLDVVKGRWGKLEPGTREYAKRLGAKGVDYRAMRLYRSEIHRHQQEAAVEEREDNPGCTGSYDWILMPGREVWLCGCEELAKARRDGKEIYDVLTEYRDFGSTDSFGTFYTHTWETGSDITEIQRLEGAYSCYPTDWIAQSIEAAKNNPLLVQKAPRGYYDHYGYLNDEKNKGHPTVKLDDRYFVPAHEFAHRMECVIPEILRLEK